MKKYFWAAVFMAAGALLTMVIYYNVIKTGTDLGVYCVFAEYAFYVLAATLYIMLVLYPVISIMFTLPYSVSDIASGKENNYKRCIKLGRNIINNGGLSAEERQQTENILSEDNERLSKKMYLLYNNTIKNNIDKLIISKAKSTFYFTAISQNGFLDMIIVLINNFAMIKKIISLCGFRPSFIRTLKLYINIFFSSLIAEGIQSINISAVLGASVSKAAKAVFNSLAGGTVNAFFMLRTGMLAKEYLFVKKTKDNGCKLRKSAAVKAAAMLPCVITSAVCQPVKNLAKMFKNRQGGRQQQMIVDLNQKWYKKNKKIY